MALTVRWTAECFRSKAELGCVLDPGKQMLGGCVPRGAAERQTFWSINFYKTMMFIFKTEGHKERQRRKGRNANLTRADYFFFS